MTQASWGSAEAGVSSSLAHNKYLPDFFVHVPQALRKEEWKAEIHSGLVYCFQETQGKMPKLEAQSFSQPLSLWWSSHELAPAGLPGSSLEAAVLITSLQACPPGRAICARLAPESALLWAPAPEWGGIDGIKVHLPGPGVESSSLRAAAQPIPHWICQKCSSASGTFLSLQPTHWFLCLHSFWWSPQQLGRMRFYYLCPTHSVDTWEVQRWSGGSWAFTCVSMVI